MVEREAKFENGYFHTDRPSLIEITNCGSIKKRLTFIKAIFVKKIIINVYNYAYTHDLK